MSRALAVSLSKRYDEAEKEFETAIRLDARLFEAYHFYVRMCYTLGKLEKAAQLFGQASEVRPENYHVPGLLGQTYVSLGREAEAEVWFRRSMALTEKHLELNPDDPRALYSGAGCLMKLNKREQGLEWADRALAIDPEDAAVLYNVACANSMAGEIEKAVIYLEKSVNAGFTDKGWIEHDPDFDPLHSHPRFQALMQEMK